MGVNQSINQSIHQSINQSINQSISQSGQPICQPVSQSVSLLVCLPVCLGLIHTETQGDKDSHRQILTQTKTHRDRDSQSLGSILEANKIPRGRQKAASWVYLRGQEDPSMAPRGTLVDPSWKPGSPQKGADVLLLGFLLEARKTPRERQEAPFWVYLRGQDDPSMAPRGTLVGPSWRPGSPQEGAKRLLFGFILEAKKTPVWRQEAPSCEKTIKVKFCFVIDGASVLVRKSNLLS